MSFTPKPLTELDAVNVMLRNIGETPVNSLSGEQVADVSEAQDTLNEVSREIQAKGWHFNREEDVPFARDSNDEVPIPNNVARFDIPQGSYSIGQLGTKDIIKRGSRAYNKTDRTYKFDQTLKAIVVYYLPFGELPESARYYITIRAARKMSNRMVTSREIEQFTRRDEYDARADFLDENEENADRSMLDNWAVGRVLQRPSRRTI